MTGYTGTYRGSVVDDADPLQQNRLLVVVPEIYGDASAWALSSLPPGDTAPLPGVGDVVWVSFEGGDAEYPIWFGMFVPAKTAREVIDKLHDETITALRTPKVKAKLASRARELAVNDPQRDAETVVRDGKRGTLADRNVELLLPTPF